MVLEKLGCEVIALRCEANGHFPDHAPDPSHVAHLQQLQATIIAEKKGIWAFALMGMVIGGITGEQATCVSPDRLISLFAQICFTTTSA